MCGFVFKMGKDRMLRKKKTFRHSSTFYRKLKQQINATTTLKNYYSVVNKQPLSSVPKDYTGTQELLSSTLPPKDKPLVLTECSGQYDAATYLEQTAYINPVDVENASEESFIPDEDFEDICDIEQRISSQISLSEQLISWYHLHKVSHSSLNHILLILKSQGIDLPTDSRTLLKTPKSLNIITMGNGQFWYNGIENCLITTFSDIMKPLSISLVFNVDGLPPFRGSAVEFWPILFKIENMPELQPMVVAIYCGETKPPLQEFLSQFVDELNCILQNGVIINKKYKIEVQIKYFVCDTPARNFIKGRYFVLYIRQ